MQAFERTVPALEMTIQPNKSTWSPLELTLQRLETSWQRPERSLQAMDSTWRGHIDRRTQALAAALEIRLLWLRKQASELNAMDQMWRELKREIAANRQYPTIDPFGRRRCAVGLDADPHRGAAQRWNAVWTFLVEVKRQNFWLPT